MVSVALVINCCTGHVSPQYQFFFDEDYITIDHLRKGRSPGNWKKLVTNNTDISMDQSLDSAKHWNIAESSAHPLPTEWTWQETPIYQTLAESSRIRPTSAYPTTNYREGVEEEPPPSGGNRGKIGNTNQRQPEGRHRPKNKGKGTGAQWRKLKSLYHCGSWGEALQQNKGDIEDHQGTNYVDLDTSGLRQIGHNRNPPQEDKRLQWHPG